MLDFVCGQPAVYLVGDDGVGVHDVLGDGFDLFHLAFTFSTNSTGACFVGIGCRLTDSE